jgi:hypothetical protein
MPGGAELDPTLKQYADFGKVPYPTDAMEPRGEAKVVTEVFVEEAQL